MAFEQTKTQVQMLRLDMAETTSALAGAKDALLELHMALNCLYERSMDETETDRALADFRPYIL